MYSINASGLCHFTFDVDLLLSTKLYHCYNEQMCNSSDQKLCATVVPLMCLIMTCDESWPTNTVSHLACPCWSSPPTKSDGMQKQLPKHHRRQMTLPEFENGAYMDSFWAKTRSYLTLILMGEFAASADSETSSPVLRDHESGIRGLIDLIFMARIIENSKKGTRKRKIWRLFNFSNDDRVSAMWGGMVMGVRIANLGTCICHVPRVMHLNGSGDVNSPDLVDWLDLIFSSCRRTSWHG